MLKVLINKYKNSKGLLNYFFLTYLDKIISFTLPLSILFIIKDKELYSFVEVAFSYATIVMIIIELGVSNYLFYGYKKSNDKEHFVGEVQVYFKFLILLYCVMLVVFGIGLNYYNDTLMILFVFVGIRALFTLFINFYSNIYRLKDNPSGIYVTSIIVNVISFILLMLAHYFSWQSTIIYFFIPSLVLVFGGSLKFIVVDIRQFRLRGFITFLNNSLQFSWPIILNVLAMSYINNYAKIYAFGHLSKQEMVQISYIMRIGLIIQLTHSAFSSFFSKSLFMDKNQKFNTTIFRQYNWIILFSSFFVVCIILVTNYFFSSQIYIPLSTSTFLFLIYIILWCYIGYLEIYFGVMNANRMVLYYSIASSVIYTGLILILKNVTVLQLSLCMVTSAIINLTLVVIGLRKLKVLSTHKTEKNKNEHNQ